MEGVLSVDPIKSLLQIVPSVRLVLESQYSELGRLWSAEGAHRDVLKDLKGRKWQGAGEGGSAFGLHSPTLPSSSSSLLLALFLGVWTAEFTLLMHRSHSEFC